MWGRLASHLVRAGRFWRLGPILAVLKAGLEDPTLWRRAAILACLRERQPDLSSAGEPRLAALAEQLLCDALGNVPEAINSPRRTP